MGQKTLICDLFFLCIPLPLPFPRGGGGVWLRGGTKGHRRDFLVFVLKNTMKEGKFEHPKGAKNLTLLVGSTLGT